MTHGAFPLERESVPDPYRDLKRFFGQYVPDEIPAGMTLSELVKGISETLPGVVTACGDVLVEALDETAASYFAERRAAMSSFRKRLRERWHKPLEALERSIVIAVDIGSDFLAACRKDDTSDIGSLCTALVGLHARGCQVASEVLTLLLHGYADAAHARWRTLHELSVIAYFIAEKGEVLADRYICHQYVEAYREALEYQEHADALGLEPLSQEEFRRLSEAREEMRARFGIAFESDYGWAAETFHSRAPTLADLRASVSLEHLQPQYRLACQNVHGAAKALFFRLGVPGGVRPFPITLAGPSDLGLADPGIETAGAVLQLTSVLLSSRAATFERLVVLDALVKIVRNSQQAFFDVHVRLERHLNGQSRERSNLPF